MKTFLLLLLSLIFEFQAFAGEPDTITNAPSGQYSITQHDVSTSDCETCFDTVLHFRDKSKPDVNLTLTEGAFADFAFRSFARYFISPDECWILRIQHLGGGTNEAFLYSVAPNGRVRRREISSPVFDRIGESLHRSINGRTQIELVSWDIPSGSMHLEASYEPLKNDVQQPWLNFNITYNLKNAKVVVTKEASDAEKAAIQPEEPGGEQLTALAFTENFVRSLATNDVETQLRSYADRVDYYEFGQVTKEVIRKDLERDITTWPNRIYSMPDPPKITPKGGDSIAEFRMAYTLTNLKGANSGILQMAVRLKLQAQTWQVVGIQKKVIQATMKR